MVQSINEMKLSKSSLNNIINSLDISIVNHLKRTKKLSMFILKNMQNYEWLSSEHLNIPSIINAIGYHDIGKLNDNNNHIESGINLINNYFNIDLKELNDSFSLNLYNGIMFHHTNYINSSIGNKKKIKGKDIPLIGRILKIVNDIDNLIFELDNDFDKLISYLKEFSNKYYDPDLINVIINNLDTFIPYLESIYNKKKNKYLGVNINYVNIINKNETKEYMYAIDYINDEYYGIISHDEYKLIAIKYDYYFFIDKLIINKVLKQNLNKNNLIIPIFNNEIENLQFIDYLKEINAKYKINKSISFVIEEEGMNITDLNMFIKNISKINNLFKIGIYNFKGRTLLQLNDLNISLIIIDSLLLKENKDNKLLFSNLNYLSSLGIDLLSDLEELEIKNTKILFKK